MIKDYPSLAKLHLRAGLKNFWADEAKIIERVNSLRGAGCRATLRDRITGRELSPKQIAQIQGKVRASLLKKEGSNLERFEMYRKALDAKIASYWVPMPADDPAKVLAGIPVEKIQDCQRVIQSSKDARDFLVLRAMGHKPKPSGTIGFGRHRLDAKKFVLLLAAATGNLKNTWANFDVAKIINQAAEEKDIRFFKSLGRKLSKKGKRVGIDLNRCDDLACFLMDFWICSPDKHPDFPPLCLFTDEALADWCDFALTPESDGGHFDAVRKCRQRLKLKNAKTPLIKSVTKDANGAIRLGSKVDK
jgi:hypothetical protein